MSAARGVSTMVPIVKGMIIPVRDATSWFTRRMSRSDITSSSGIETSGIITSSWGRASSAWTTSTHALKSPSTCAG
jgi:hypothetical protein